MPKDENVVAEPTEPQEPVEPTEPTEPAEPQEPQEDYRGKLNATNNFLKKEGYTFDEEKKQWNKPASQPHEPKKPKAQDNERETAAEQRAAKAEERAARAELRSMGISHPDDLKIVMEAAKDLGIDPVEAAERKYVKAELEAQQEVRRSKDATPAPRRSGSSGTKDIGALADKVAKGEALPTDPALSEKVQQELARRAQASS